MANSGLVLVLIAAIAGASIPRTETSMQDTVFRQWWNDEFVWKLDALPVKGSVPKDRVPYSGYIYLDKQGGTADVLYKYDLAMNRNRGVSATAWERADSAEAVSRRGGRFFSRAVVNDWYGHCNGWASAAIRHAEPQHGVTVNGIEFTPADIKGLLAEAYVYNHHEVLAGYESDLNPGSLHAILANWIGRGSHAIVMDSDPSEEKWNYPIYSFASALHKHSEAEVEVRTNILYAKDSEDREHQVSPRLHAMKSFHYMLQLNPRGEIVGGYYFRDSDRLDFLWIPLSPKAAGEAGNENGNPHLDVAQVLNIWRQSVDRNTRRQWLITDPSEEDRAVEVPDPTRILPRNIKIVPPAAPTEPAARTAQAP